MNVIYDYYKEKGEKRSKGRFIPFIILAAVLILVVIGISLYLQIIQLDEIGGYSGVYLTNLLYKAVSFGAAFLVIFAAIAVSNRFIIRNIRVYIKENGLEPKRLINLPIAAVIAFIGGLVVKEVFYQKFLTFTHATSFGTPAPIVGKDIGYYIFQRPFLMSIYDFVSSLWLFVILYTAAYYLAILFTLLTSLSWKDLKVRTMVRHNLVNLAIFFLIKVFSYRFLKEGIVYSNVVQVTGASYVDVNVWMKYYSVAPFLLLAIVAVSLVFIWKGHLKRAAICIGVFPALWLIVSVTALAIQGFIVKPNEIDRESPYLAHNMTQTRQAYQLDKIKNFDFPTMEDLSPEVLQRNAGTIENIRVVDYKPTLDSDIQIQSNTNFYTFANGDIINYVINGKETPVFIAAREIDKSNLKDKSSVNMTYKYTHGYGVVINPINRVTPEGQVEFVLKDLRMQSDDPLLKVSEPRIYYGEMTQDHVIVNAKGLNEIDYDGLGQETRYQGKGGIKLNFLNRLLFSAKYGDFNMLISGYASNSTLLLNRDIVARAQKAAPFLTIDQDPYIIIRSDGKLEWVLDAYTTSSSYPYAQSYNDINYIRNSVKITVDAYDGTVRYYIIDHKDPIIETYSKIYPELFTNDPLPADIQAHMRYPEELFRIQTEMLKRYHLDPDSDPNNISKFYSNQDLWDLAQYPEKQTGNVVNIEPYYNMIKLPEGVGSKEELILMRPFTPSNKTNMVSWLAVRNDAESYGELILFKFPKNTNIFGPYQAEVKINQIDQISKDMTLWGQSGSSVFKGSLLVIPVESSVLYVEPIYIQASGESSIPEVREIVVGYQKGDEFKYGIGTDLQKALANLFGTGIQSPVVPAPQQPGKGTENAVDEKLLKDLLSKYDELKKQLDDLGNLLENFR